MCVVQTQLYQCCCLPDEPLNHPQLLKYHGNFCKCRNAQCNPVARFQLTMLHPPCSFTFLLSAAPLPSNSAPEVAHPAPAVPRTLQALQSQPLPDHRWVVQPFARITYMPFPFEGAWVQWAPKTHKKWRILEEVSPHGPEALLCQLHSPEGDFKPQKHNMKIARTCWPEPTVPCETVKQRVEFTCRDWEQSCLRQVHHLLPAWPSQHWATVPLYVSWEGQPPKPPHCEHKNFAAC